jgi:predicted membrane protein
MPFQIREEKMRSSMFWGLFFVVLGSLMLLNYIFGLNLPVFRILVAIGIIYLGVKILFGSHFSGKKIASDYQAVFSSSQFNFPSRDSQDTANEYSTVFGDAVLDLRDLDLSKGPADIEMNVVFGHTNVLLKKGTPYKIESNTVFGNIQLPDKKTSSVGEWSHQSDNYPMEKNHLTVHANVVFGQLRVEFE